MWIPTPIYERIPQFWVLIGLLFMSSGVYLGFDYQLIFVYFGAGALCFAWGVRLFVMRFVHRKAKQGQQQEQQIDAEPAGSL
jgi:membrane protein implicated in regulation of membrane protease activity